MLYTHDLGNDQVMQFVLGEDEDKTELKRIKEEEAKLDAEIQKVEQEIREEEEELRKQGDQEEG